MAVMIFKSKLAINSQRVLYIEKSVHNGHKSIEVYFIGDEKPIRISYTNTQDLEHDFILAIACFESA